MSQHSWGRSGRAIPSSCCWGSIYVICLTNKGSPKDELERALCGPCSLAPMQRILRLNYNYYRPLRNACLKMIQGLFEQPCLASLSTTAGMYLCTNPQAPPAPVAGLSRPGVLRIRAGACRSIVISAQSQHSDSQGDNYSRRAALLATASGAALLAAPHCELLVLLHSITLEIP